MGEHTAQFVRADDLQQALGHRDRGVVGVAAGRERVGLLRGADVDLGHRHVGALGEIAHDAVQLRRFLLGDGLRAGGLHRERVGEPVGPADEHQADTEADDEATGAEERPDDHEEDAESRKQDGGLDRVLEHAPYNVPRGRFVPFRCDPQRVLSRSSRSGRTGRECPRDRNISTLRRSSSKASAQLEAGGPQLPDRRLLEVPGQLVVTPRPHDEQVPADVVAAEPRLGQVVDPVRAGR